MSLAGSYNGLAFGPGTKIHVAREAGLDDMPPIRSADIPRANDHGSWAGIDWLGPRTIDLEFLITGDDFNDYAALVNSMQTAFLVQPAELPLLLKGSKRQVKARVRRNMLPYAADRIARAGTAMVQLVAMDPRIYDATLQQIAIGLPTASGGVTFNAAFNLGFGSAGVGGSAVVTNAGNFPTRPVITIVGPCTTPIVQNVTAGKALQFNLTLAAGDVLAVDLDAKSVLLTVNGSNSSASRRSSLAPSSSWWELAPGNSTITYRATTYQAASTATIAFRSAWLGTGGVQ